MKRYESVHKFILRIESFHGSKSSFKVFETKEEALDYATKLIKKELSTSNKKVQQLDFIDHTIKDKQKQSVEIYNGTTLQVNKEYIKI